MNKLIVFLALPLAGCGVTAKIDARQDYQASEAQYKACLTANPADDGETRTWHFFLINALAEVLPGMVPVAS